MVDNLTRYFELNRGKRKQRHILGLHLKSGNPLIDAFTPLVYLAVKLLYIVNIIVQMAFLRWFLNPIYFEWLLARLITPNYARQILSKVLSMSQIQWLISSLRLYSWWTGRMQPADLFPIVAMCDFKARELSHKQWVSYRIQCVLMVNQWNALIYIISGFSAHRTQSLNMLALSACGFYCCC